MQEISGERLIEVLSRHWIRETNLIDRIGAEARNRGEVPDLGASPHRLAAINDICSELGIDISFESLRRKQEYGSTDRRNEETNGLRV